MNKSNKLMLFEKQHHSAENNNNKAIAIAISQDICTRIFFRENLSINWNHPPNFL
jgi:hypothetical protein